MYGILTYIYHKDAPFMYRYIYIPIGSMYGIFTYIWLIFRVNVGKYTSPMDPMGYTPLRRPMANLSGNIFGSNLGRLQEIKAKYDANNVPGSYTKLAVVVVGV